MPAIHQHKSIPGAVTGEEDVWVLFVGFKVPRERERERRHHFIWEATRKSSLIRWHLSRCLSEVIKGKSFLNREAGACLPCSNSKKTSAVGVKRAGAEWMRSFHLLMCFPCSYLDRRKDFSIQDEIRSHGRILRRELFSFFSPFHSSRIAIKMESCVVLYILRLAFFHSALCAWDTSKLFRVSVVHCILMLRSIPLYGCTTICSAIDWRNFVFPVWGSKTKAAVNSFPQVFMWKYFFISLG